jgi:SAM-dependent MidA family methyltransferase
MTPLALKIRAQIQQSGGWIGTDAFMQAALYTPGLGYYSGGADPFGPSRQMSGAVGGDFVTGPMLGPWLAQAIWDWASPLRPLPNAAKDAEPFRIREFGGGRGDLAAGLMRRAAEDSRQPDPRTRVHIEMIELSADLQERQRRATQGLGTITWHSALAPGFRGLVIANEVLDAMPVKCFEWAGGDQVLEWGVAASPQGELTWASRPAQKALQQAVLARQQAALARGLPWDIGYRGEFCPWLGPWCQSLSDTMTHGAVLLIDYGYAQPELDHPGRTRGTLCAHHRHQRVDEPHEMLQRVGQQDLTAHVDFSHVAKAATAAGFDVRGFVTQARFLMNSGLLTAAQRLVEGTDDVVSKTRLLQSLQMLLSESEMGEVFKVMLLTKQLSADVSASLYNAGFITGDRRDSL